MPWEKSCQHAESLSWKRSIGRKGDVFLNHSPISRASLFRGSFGRGRGSANLKVSLIREKASSSAGKKGDKINAAWK